MADINISGATTRTRAMAATYHADDYVIRSCAQVEIWLDDPAIAFTILFTGPNDIDVAVPYDVPANGRFTMIAVRGNTMRINVKTDPVKVGAPANMYMRTT